MTPTTVADRVYGLLATVTRADEVRGRTDLRPYDGSLLDSLAAVELTVSLSEDFGIDVSPADLDRKEWPTSRALVADVERRLRA